MGCPPGGGRNLKLPEIGAVNGTLLTKRSRMVAAIYRPKGKVLQPLEETRRP